MIDCVLSRSYGAFDITKNTKRFDIASVSLLNKHKLQFTINLVHRNRFVRDIEREFDIKMANLKDDLDEYLLLQSDQKKNFKIDIKMPTLKVPEIKNLFGKSQPPEANGWLQDTRDSCFPKLVSHQIEIAIP